MYYDFLKDHTQENSTNKKLLMIYFGAVYVSERCLFFISRMSIENVNEHRKCLSTCDEDSRENIFFFYD